MDLWTLSSSTSCSIVCRAVWAWPALTAPTCALILALPPLLRPYQVVSTAPAGLSPFLGGVFRPHGSAFCFACCLVTIVASLEKHLALFEPYECFFFPASFLFFFLSFSLFSRHSLVSVLCFVFARPGAALGCRFGGGLRVFFGAHGIDVLFSACSMGL